MIAAARISVLAAAAGAALLVAGPWPQPAAAADECKPDIVTATGRGKFRPFTKTKELEGRGSAMADAVATWQREVAATHGDRWKLWSEARDKSFECEPTKGKVLAGLVACTIHGRPCATAEAAPAPAIVSGTGEKGGGRDSEREVAIGGRSWRYRQEMRRQQTLANWRKRREEWAWEREKQRQRYLERLRDRAEEAGWERTNARERWLARERD